MFSPLILAHHYHKHGCSSKTSATSKLAHCVPGVKFHFNELKIGTERMPGILRCPATQHLNYTLSFCIYTPQQLSEAFPFHLRYPWQTEERLAAEAALRAMGVVTASMGGNLASSGNQDGQAQAATTSDGKAPSPDKLLAQSPPSDALAVK